MSQLLFSLRRDIPLPSRWCFTICVRWRSGGVELFSDLEAYNHESAYGRQEIYIKTVIMSLRTDTNLEAVSNVWVAPISLEHCSYRFLGSGKKYMRQYMSKRRLLWLIAAYSRNKTNKFQIQRLNIGWNIRSLLDLKNRPELRTVLSYQRIAAPEYLYSYSQKHACLMRTISIKCLQNIKLELNFLVWSRNIIKSGLVPKMTILRNYSKNPILFIFFY